jgi:heat shock protein HslJ
MDADANGARRKSKKARTRPPAVRVVTPPAEPPSPVENPSAAPAIALSGTYALTRIGGRPVRDAELAATRITFMPRFDVVGTTACNSFSGRLHTDPAASKIVGFDNLVATERGCATKQAQAEATTLRILRQTANIARAGNSITLFNSIGLTLAQFSAVENSAAEAEPVAAPTQAQAGPAPRGASVPTRSYFGDYVLSELGGAPVAVRVPANTIPRPVTPPNARFLTNLPTLYLRENGAASGLSGCNQYTTSLVNAGAQPVRFGPLTSTRKRCLERSTERSEREVQTAFRDAARVEITATRVNLIRADGTRLARFSAANARQSRGPTLVGPSWVLRSINGARVPATNPPNLVFEGNQVIGFAGCNQFNMVHNRRGNRSRFQDGAMTRMACVDRARSDLEQRFMSGLTSVTRLDVTQTSLTMRSDDGATIMVFEAD